MGAQKPPLKKMQVIYSKEHFYRNAKTELCGGQLVPPFECPQRAEYIVERCRERKIGEIITPHTFKREHLLSIHDDDYLHFLETCWSRWKDSGNKGEAIASTWPSRAMTRMIPPNEIDGLIGYYCLAAETSISSGTWRAAVAAANVALSGQQLLAEGARVAFSLCRPPGHHAPKDMFGGYCFLNNTALAAQAFCQNSATRIAILDVDFHHGNGTQAIFYNREDVFFLSLHGDPMDAFPYFLGAADETGEGVGVGFNKNYPLPPGTDFKAWNTALQDALTRIKNYAPEALIVSLGVDTYEKDPISFFRLKSEDFLRYGESIGQLNLPTLFVMEGGYAVEEIGINTVNVLEGFETATR